jgi:hypothetical protein
MLDPTVPTTPDTDEPEIKRADELKAGDWIGSGELTGGPAQVLSAHSYKDGDRVAKVFLVVLIDGIPDFSRVNAWRVYELATAAELAQAKDEERRFLVADQLRQLAENVLKLQLPLSIENGQVRMTSQLGSVAEVADLGERLGIPVEVDTAGRNSVFWPAGGKSYDPGVRVEWYRYDPDFKKPDAEDPDHGRTTAVAEAKPDTLGVALGRASVPTPDGGE